MPERRRPRKFILEFERAKRYEMECRSEIDNNPNAEYAVFSSVEAATMYLQCSKPIEARLVIDSDPVNRQLAVAPLQPPPIGQR